MIILQRFLVYLANFTHELGFTKDIFKNLLLLLKKLGHVPGNYLMFSGTDVSVLFTYYGLQKQTSKRQQT